MKDKLIPLLFGLLALAGGVIQAAQLGTAINYQGRLTDGGSSANGTHSFRYRLVADQAGITQIGPVVDLSNQNVSGGLFNATLDFGAGAFNGQERWLEISVKTGGPGAAQDYIKLNPQPLPPGGSSLFARIAGDVLDGTITGPRIAPLAVTSGNLADGAVTAGKLAAGSVSSSQITDGSITAADIANNQVVKSLNINGSGNLLRDTVNLAAGANVTLTPSGNTVTISSAGPGGAGLWTAPGGGSIYYNGGNVGIGSVTPQAKLEIVGEDALRLVGYQPFLTLLDSDNNSYAQARIQDVGGNLVLLPHSGVTGNAEHNVVVRTGTGNVGIGSPEPLSKLEVVGQDALGLVGFQPYLTLKDSGAGYAKSRIQGAQGDLFLETHDYTVSGNPLNGLIVLKNGTGKVGIGTASPQAMLDVNGTMQTKVLTITGGADLAEPFPMKEETIDKGSVVVIDEEHPGQLKLSTRAYDTQVAGIVSGANGINPGIALKQEGALDSGHNVALTGRVYVKADASHRAIKPGDLLTTSDTPGHAMKVSDHTKSQGAILGKAMSALGEGTGLVLVLVTLQ